MLTKNGSTIYSSLFSCHCDLRTLFKSLQKHQDWIQGGKKTNNCSNIMYRMFSSFMRHQKFTSKGLKACCYLEVKYGKITVVRLHYSQENWTCFSYLDVHFICFSDIQRVNYSERHIPSLYSRIWLWSWTSWLNSRPDPREIYLVVTTKPQKLYIPVNKCPSQFCKD